MEIISSTGALEIFCKRAAEHPFVTVDTEFLRERTYYAQLCLVQLAIPEDSDGSAVLVDTLAEDLDLAPLYELFANPSVTKVFHAARQDLEIFFVDQGKIPTPVFDTQIAAMVCGFGEQVGYETLVRKICNTGLDKSSRFTDWSRRPLSAKQKAYALADVTHLRDIYRHLSQELEHSGRAAWVTEELESLTDTDSYIVQPEQAWRRLKTRSNSRRFLAVVRELAALRERLAQHRNVPRNRVFKDDVILELAATRPTSTSDLSGARLLQRDARRGDLADAIVEAVGQAMALEKGDLPEVPQGRMRPAGNEALADLLRVLLKARAEEVGVAQKLVATAADLDAIARGEKNGIAALKGWRRDVFGKDAMQLCDGEIALSAKGDRVTTVQIDPVRT